MMFDLSSVAREAAEARYPLEWNSTGDEVWGYPAKYSEGREGFERGFAECASRIPSEEEFGAVVLKHFHGPDELHSSWWINTEEMGAAIAALIGEKISG